MTHVVHDLSYWTHQHRYSIGNPVAERGTRLVMWITLATMVVEIVAGWWFNSMAVLADGWHMSSHALAIGLSALAYGASRKYADDPRFAFGTWKIEVLAGYTSAIFLLGVALAMAFGSVERLVEPQPIRYIEAIGVAIFGLLVNVVCALILGRADTHHHHDHGHAHDHPRQHHGDLNLKAAYIHVLTDALTSVLAIVALAGGWLFAQAWLDPAMGLVGALLVGLWAKNLILQTARVLLDREMDHPVVEEIREVIAALPEDGATEITDLHVWRVGNGEYACALALLTHDDGLTPAAVRDALAIHEEIVHVTVEIHRCETCPPTGI